MPGPDASVALQAEPVVRTFADALDALQDGFVVLDPGWRVVFANRTAARRLGTDPQELLGAVIWDRFPALRGTPIEAAYRRVMAEREPLSVDVEGAFSGRWYRVGISPCEPGICALWSDVTELKLTDDALRESEQRYSIIHDRAPFAIALVRLADRRLVSVNNAFVRLFGFRREELIGKDSVELGISDSASQAAVAEELRTRGAVRDLEVTRVTRSGERRILSLNLDEVLIGGSAHALTTIQDVTDRKRAQELLQAQLAAQEQLARIAASVPGAIYTFELRPDGTSCMPFAAEALDDLYGIPREVLARDTGPCFANVHPDDVPAVEASIAASARDGTPWHAEFRYRHPVKGLRWMEGWSRPSREPDGRVVWHGYVADVSDRKQAEASLLESERRATSRAAELQAVLDTVPAAVWIARDPAGSLIEGNRFAAELLRTPQGSNMSISAPPGDRPANFRLMKDGVELRDDELPIQAAARRGTEIRDYALDVVFDDGSVRLLGNAAPIREGGRTMGSVGAFIDVTSRRRAEERERAAAARDAFRLRLADALRPLADPGAIAGTASELLAAFLGADRVLYGEVRGGEVIAADDFHAAGLVTAAGRHRLSDYGATVVGAMHSGRTMVVHDVAGTPVGDPQRVMAETWSIRAWVIVPLRKGGAFAACLVAATRAPRPWSAEEVALVEEVAERTWSAVERARAEAALREEARRKDEFLAVLSHELRNPLAPIRNSVYILARAAPGSEQVVRAVEVLRRQTDHVTRLVDDLLDVTRISRGKITLRREQLDLRDVVRRTADDLRSIFDEGGVELRVELPAGPAWVQADRTRISQVLANLLHNASKFTPRGAAVVVRAEVRDGWAELRVRDEGVGMEPSQLERMFEPFAQADQGIARTQGGLGLGLALVKGLVELHGGTVTARSEGIGHGAEFTVTLPCSADAAPQGELAIPRRGAARDVLVIEDNPDAAETLGDVLSLLGHRVRITNDGRSGLAAARAVRPDVILCDIGLPDLSGYELARAIRADPTFEGTRLVALTGYAQPEDRQRALDAGFDAHAAKPLEPEVLARLVTG